MRIEGKVLGAAEVSAKFARAGVEVNAAVRKIVTELGTRLQARVKETKLSDEVLHVRTGRLRRNINLRLIDDGNGVYASVGTNVVYGRIQELGGVIKIPATYVTVRRKVLASGDFADNGRFVSKRRANFETEHYRKAYEIHIPERSYLRSALADMRQEILDRLQSGIGQAIKDAGR